VSGFLPYSYRKVHATLRRLHGPATDHTCSCGDPAVEWAYQYTGDPELRNADGGYPHSANPDDYVAMCRGCHVRFDLEKDPAMAERRTAWRPRPDNVERWHDPEYREMMQTAQRGGGIAVARKRRRCLECGLVASPGGMGNHRNSSGHDNYEEI
jgi:hypothetical protein